jgi:hypothetical protein
MATAAVSIEVETPGDGRPHRVIVTGLDEAAAAALGRAGPAERARALAVYTGEEVRPDLPAIAGTYTVEARGLSFQPRLPFVTGVRYLARFDRAGVRVDRAFEVSPPAAPRRGRCRTSSLASARRTARRRHTSLFGDPTRR